MCVNKFFFEQVIDPNDKMVDNTDIVRYLNQTLEAMADITKDKSRSGIII